MRTAGLLVVPVLILNALPVLAQTPTPTTAAAPAEATPTASPSPAPTPVPFTGGYRNGFVLQSPSGDFVLRLSGYAQADGRFAIGDDNNAVTNSFLLRRVRPILSGTVAQYFEFYINPDFGGGTTVLQDAYADVRFSSKLRIRAGKIKSPFGLERLQSGTSLLFVERALPTGLAPNRDVGLQIHGDLKQGVFAYQAAVLNGAADGGSVDTDTNDGKELVGRVFLQPLRTQYQSPLRGLGLGIAASTGKAVGALAGYRSVSQINVFAYHTTVTADPELKRTRFSPQGYFFGGPIGILAEYVQSTHNVVRTTPASGTTPASTAKAELTNSSWQVTGSFLVTGEEAAYGNVKPKNFFVPSTGKLGALQLVARVNKLKVDEDTFTGGFANPAASVREATGIGVGLNWIWNQNLKYVLDYEQTKFQGGAAAGADRPTEKSLQTRLHLSY